MNALVPLDFVTIGNRTSKPLTVVYDGRQWMLPPHPVTVSLPRIVADAACRQHPVMGTEDPYDPRSYDLLVYVKEWDQPSTPIEQSTAKERLNRALLPADVQKTQLVEHGTSRVQAVRDGDPAARFTKS